MFTNEAGFARGGSRPRSSSRARPALRAWRQATDPADPSSTCSANQLLGCAATCAPSLVGSFWASSFWASRTEDQNCGFELAAGFALLAGAVGHAANGRFAVRRRAAASAHRDWRRCGGTGTPGAPAGPRRGSWRAGRSEPQAVACCGGPWALILGGLQLLPPASALLLRILSSGIPELVEYRFQCADDLCAFRFAF